MTTTAPDLITTWTTGWVDAVQQWTDQSQAMWEQLGLAPWVRQGGPRPEARGAHRHHQGHEHHHHECGCEADTCACCVPEADVVLHARVGERRVIPFVLHNRWRRERPVTIEVGPWHPCGGAGLTITATVKDPAITLAPCEDRVVRLLIAVAAVSDVTDKPAREAGTTARLHDLEQCSSAYADVRFEGCARPQRVAIVVEPAHCDPVDVTCDCGCC